LVTNKAGAIFGSYEDRLYSTGYLLKRADPVGNFLLGSSVVLVFSAPKTFQFVVEPGQKVEYGEALGFVVDNKQTIGG